MTSQHQSQLSEAERALAAGYVLGDLSDDEQRQMDALLAQRPDIQREVDALSASLRSLPHSLPFVEPPPHLESAILTAYTNDMEISGTNEGTSKGTNQGRSLTPSTSGIPLSPSPRSLQEQDHATPKSPIPWTKLLAGMTTLAALLLGANNVQLRQQLAQSLDDNVDADRAVQILQQSNSRLVSLASTTATHTTAGGTLLFTAGQWQEVVVSLNNLPPLPVDQVYRMWLTLENGEVLFCGEFNTNADGTVLVRLNPPEVPPQGVKTTGLFVTQDAMSAALNATGTPIMVGEI